MNKHILLLASILALASITASFCRADTAAVPAADLPQPSWLVMLANQALSYCTTNHNFVPTSGPGGTIDGLRRGNISAVIAESLTVYDNGKTNACIKLDLAHTTAIATGKTHEGLGVDVRYIGQLPPSWKLHLPVLGRLGTFHSLIGISPDLDTTMKGQFGQKTTVCWASFGLGGE